MSSLCNNSVIVQLVALQWLNSQHYILNHYNFKGTKSVILILRGQDLTGTILAWWNLRSLSALVIFWGQNVKVEYVE